MKKILILLLLSITFGLITGCGLNETAGYGVTIISNKIEYAPVIQWIYGLSDGLAADGTRKQPEEVKDELDAIVVSDDFEIRVTGTVVGNPSYTLFYDDTFETVYYRSDKYGRPDDTGSYILCIEIAFGKANDYEGYQYWFRLSV